MRLRRAAAIFALTAIVAACASEPGTIFRKFDLESGQSVTTGARQRVILNNDVLPTSRPGLVNPKRIVCAEPSPDVAIAVANSFGSSLSVFGYGSGAISGDQAEGIAQLAERTVTVQLLRDQMYRACESYANGAISAANYSLLMSKNNDAMITLLLGEVAGGAFGRSLATLDSKTESEANAALQGFAAVTGEFSDAVEQLNKANLDVATAQQNVNDKQKIFDGIDAAKTDEKTAAKTELDKAKADLAAKTATRDTIAEGLQSKSEAVAKSAAEVRSTAAGAINTKADAAVANVIAEIQKEFLKEDFADEYVSACIVELGLANYSDPKTDDHEVAMLARLMEVYTEAQWQEIEQHENARLLFTRADRLGKIANDRLSAATAIMAQRRYTALAFHCEDHLLGFMDAALSDRLTVELASLENEKTINHKDMLAEYGGALKGCAAIKDPAQQTQCLNNLAKLIDPASAPLPVPVGARAANAPALPIISFQILEKLRTDLANKQTELNGAAIPADTADDPLKDKKKELRTAQTALKNETVELLAEVGQQVSAAKKVQAQELNNKWGELEVDRRAAEQQNDADEVKKYAALMTAQQIDAKALDKTHSDLAVKIRSLIDRIDAHIAAVKALK